MSWERKIIRRVRETSCNRHFKADICSGEATERKTVPLREKMQEIGGEKEEGREGELREKERCTGHEGSG